LTRLIQEKKVTSEALRCGLFLKAVIGCQENIGDKKGKNEELETSIFQHFLRYQTDQI